MSWSISVSDVSVSEIGSELQAKMDEFYPNASHGSRVLKNALINREFRAASAVAEDFAHDAFETDLHDARFNVQASGHVHDNDAESFVSVIVTLRKPQEAVDDPAED